MEGGIRRGAVVSTGGVQQAASAETALGWKYETVPAWRSLRPGEVQGFQYEGLNVDSKEMWCLADLSAPRAGEKGCLFGRSHQTRALESRPCRRV